MIRNRISIVVAAVCLAATSVVSGQGKTSGQTAGVAKSVIRVGTARLTGTEPNADDGFLGVRDEPEADVTFSKPQTSGAMAPARVSADHVPMPAGNAIAAEPITGFSGITHLEQRLAPTLSPTGINLSLTPPDQGLAVGNGFVVEAVNNAVAIFNATTHQRLRLQALSGFFGLAPDLELTTNISGPFLSDPRVYYDWPSGRFFLTELEIGTVPATGDFGNTSALLIAVSQSNDPTGAWNIYKIDTTSDGIAAFGTCPCFGDQPLIGADANGFYVTTNGFSLSTFTFRGAQVYAISKAALIAGGGGTITARRFAPQLQAPDTVAFTIQPATVPPGGSFAVNTEYFMSSLDPNNTLDNRLTVWALTGTNSLATAKLISSTVATEVYGLSPAMQQRDGATPLLDQLATGPSLFVDGSLFKNHLELIESNDDRLQQVVYAAGRLWTGLNTVIKTKNGPVRAAAAWFIVQPSVSESTVSGTVVKQGYLSLNNNNVVFPSIGVNAAGKGVIGVSVIGADLFPSAAFARVDAVSGAGPLVVAGAGGGPLDDFSGYAPFGFRAARWGDYSAAVADERGDVWLANEYVPNAPRTVLTNWGTFVTKVTP
jgi:hypothetical protein